MARKIENPTVREGQGPLKDSTEYQHPAYATIGASRSSGHTNLFDSDFKHSAFMTVRIGKAFLRRDLSRDWVYSGLRGDYIEVHMSESQWATFVSSPNVGSGVPCTLYRFNGEEIPGLPDPAPVTERYAKDYKERLARAQDGLSELKEILAGKLSKKQAEELARKIDVIGYDIGINLDFVAKSFDEHMEQTVDKAKAEFHGYANHMLTKAGMQALGLETDPQNILEYNPDPQV